MRHRIALAVVCLLAGVLFVLWAGTVHAAPPVPRFEVGPCPIEVPGEPVIECGTLVTLEDREDRGGRTVRLPVLIVHSRSANPAPDPLLVTLGGPGYTSVGEVWGYARSAFVQERDVVILEQRGNLHADPSLDCDLAMWVDTREGYTPCLDSLRSRGIDPADYTAADIAADIGDLFEVMAEARRYERWNLYGGSFSTRLMLLAMRDYPQRVRSAVLQSVNSGTDTRYAHDPEHSARALDLFFADCAADSGCAAAFPDLKARFWALYSRLNAAPVTFEVPQPETGETEVRTVDGYTLLEWMVGDAFYGAARSRAKTAFLPLLIDGVERGDIDLLDPWVKEQWRRAHSLPFAFGLYFSVNCQDDYWPGAREAMAVQAGAFPELEGYVRHGREVEICEAWGLNPAPPLFGAPLESDIPALVLAGAYDPITPPQWSRDTADALGNATYVQFPGYGHDLSTGNACAEQIMVTFLRDPAERLDVGCAAAPPEFVLPAEVMCVPNVYEYYFDEIGRSRLEHNLYLASENAMPLVLLSAAVGGLAWLALGRQGRVPFDAWLWVGLVLAGLASALFFAFSQGMRSVVRELAATDGILLRFGVPPATRPWFSLAMAAAALTVGLVALLVNAWFRRRGPVWGRVVVAFATAPVVAFALLLVLWGWLSL